MTGGKKKVENSFVLNLNLEDDAVNTVSSMFEETNGVSYIVPVDGSEKDKVINAFEKSVPKTINIGSLGVWNYTNSEKEISTASVDAGAPFVSLTFSNLDNIPHLTVVISNISNGKIHYYEYERVDVI